MDTMVGIIDRELERHPHNCALIEAFRPVLMARKDLLQRMRFREMDSFTCDEARFRGGVSVLGQCNLFHQDDPWTEMATDLFSGLFQLVLNNYTLGIDINRPQIDLSLIKRRVIVANAIQINRCLADAEFGQKGPHNGFIISAKSNSDCSSRKSAGLPICSLSVRYTHCSGFT